MSRIDLICKHPFYQNKLERLILAEKDRVFCKHTMEHFIDVARLMYIKLLKDDLRLDIPQKANDLDVAKDLIYAAALLHDIGRIDQIETGKPHDQASADFCREILPACSFAPNEVAYIADAIKNHRGDKKLEIKSEKKEVTLSDLLYWADKKSRNCFMCKAREECNWPKEKMNDDLIF